MTAGGPVLIPVGTVRAQRRQNCKSPTASVMVGHVEPMRGTRGR